MTRDKGYNANQREELRIKGLIIGCIDVTDTIPPSTEADKLGMMETVFVSVTSYSTYV